MLSDIKTICSLPPNRIKKGLIGVEVEMEGANIPLSSVGDDWIITGDSSLRGESAEYVFREPMSLEEGKKAVVNLYRKFNSRGSELTPSIRCGVHVHFNVQDMNVIQLFNFITTYLIFEDVLVGFCGPSREGNLFCLRASDAEYMLHMFKECLETGRLSLLNNDNIRYSSVNLKSLYKFGSVEFRALATPKQPDTILAWIDLLNKVKVFSEQFTYPTDIIQYIKKNSFYTLYNSCFQEAVIHLNSVQDVEKKVRKGLKNAKLVSCTIDWTSFKAKNNNPFSKVSIDYEQKIVVPKRIGKKYVSSNYRDSQEFHTNSIAFDHPDYLGAQIAQEITNSLRTSPYRSSVSTRPTTRRGE